MKYLNYDDLNQIYVQLKMYELTSKAVKLNKFNERETLETLRYKLKNEMEHIEKIAKD
jgi:hypothetical protein